MRKNAATALEIKARTNVVWEAGTAFHTVSKDNDTKTKTGGTKVQRTQCIECKKLRRNSGVALVCMISL